MIYKQYKLSKYNVGFEYVHKYYLYNSITNSLACLDRNYFFLLEEIKKNEEIRPELKPILHKLIMGGFIVDNDMDELARVKVIYNSKKWVKFLSFTIAPTLSCNCNCPYCFQQKSSKSMEKDTYKTISEVIKKNYLNRNINDIRITWYGGEPLLEEKNIRMFYKTLSYFVSKNNLTTSIITNGTLLRQAFIDYINKYTKISKIQVTIDGEKDIHDKKRCLKDGIGTYDLIMKNVLNINEVCKISMRINIDKESLVGIEKLFKDLKTKKVDKKKNIFIYFGHLRNYTDNVKMGKEKFLSKSEFSKKIIKLHKNLYELGFKNTLYPNVFPSCMFDHYNSFVVDPFGDLFKCWDLIGNKKAKIGNIKNINNILENPVYVKFMNYDPMSFSSCKNCILLPICLGQCAMIRMGLSKIDFKKDLCIDSKKNLIDQLKYRIYCEDKCVNQEKKYTH